MAPIVIHHGRAKALRYMRKQSIVEGFLVIWIYILSRISLVAFLSLTFNLS